MGEYACVVKPSRRVVVVAGSALFAEVLPRGGRARHRVTPVNSSQARSSQELLLGKEPSRDSTLPVGGGRLAAPAR